MRRIFHDAFSARRATSEARAAFDAPRSHLSAFVASAAEDSAPPIALRAVLLFPPFESGLPAFRPASHISFRLFTLDHLMFILPYSALPYSYVMLLACRAFCHDAPVRELPRAYARCHAPDYLRLIFDFPF